MTAVRPHQQTLVADLIWWLTSLLVRLFYRIERMGGDVPDGPVLLVANHGNGLLDPAIVVHTASRRPRFMGKSTLFTIPVVGWLARQVGTIPVCRRADTPDTSGNEEMFRAVLGTGWCRYTVRIRSVTRVGTQRDLWNELCVSRVRAAGPACRLRQARWRYAAAECAVGISVARRKMLASSVA